MVRPVPQRITTGFLIALAFITASGPFATDLYLPGMPEVARDLHTTSSLAQLTLSAFMLGMAVGQLVIGVLSDASGRMRPMRIGAVIALIGVIMCAVAPNITVLILARLIHGLGAGACLVVARAMVPDISTGKETARAFTVLMMIQGIAPVIAPIAGGLLVGPVGWRGIFWTLTAIVMIQVTIAYQLPETLPKEHRGEFGVKALGRTFSSVLRNRAFCWYTVSFATLFGGFFAYISASSFVIQEQWHFGATTFSLIFAVNAMGLILSGFVSNRLLHSFTEYQIARAGLLVLLCAGIGTSLLALMDGPVALKIFFLFFSAAPLSLATGNITGIAVQEVPNNAGSAAAVMGFFQFVTAAAVSPLVGLGNNENLTMGICMIVGYSISVAALLTAKKISDTNTPS
ncbi:MAG: multidrug effflux MFS transporter [Corynebacterium sp.]|nr:multidrug effflux MFS transporter [Corynebacterium sp.]